MHGELRVEEYFLQNIMEKYWEEIPRSTPHSIPEGITETIDGDILDIRKDRT